MLFHRRIPDLEKQRGNARIESRAFCQPADFAIQRLPHEHRDRVVQNPGQNRTGEAEAGLSSPMAYPKRVTNPVHKKGDRDVNRNRMAEGTDRKRIREKTRADGDRYRGALTDQQGPTNNADEEKVNGEI
jgi:hypothetical protein